MALKRGTYGDIKPGPFQKAMLSAEGHAVQEPLPVDPIRCSSCGRFTGPKGGGTTVKGKWLCRSCRPDRRPSWW